MGEGEGGAAATKMSQPPPPPRPTITVPPRAPFESFFSGGSVPGFSPGPMTLLSNFFSPDSNSCSFSQLLSGAMTPPIARPDFLDTVNNEIHVGSKEGDLEDGNESNDKGLEGYKQNRPMGLTVPNSPMFFIPPGFSPAGFLNSPPFLSPLQVQSPFGMSHQQALAHVTAQAAFSQSFTQMQAGYECSSAAASSVEVLETKPSSIPITLPAKVDNASLEPQTLQIVEVDASHFDKKPVSFLVDKPSNDGYNWRKYGQKLVKSKEHPRSYYKCTYLNCPVKKKVERAADGHIAEITYKGHHNHDIPQPNVRAKDVRTQDGNKAALVKPDPSPQKQQLPMSSEHDEMEDSAVVIDEDNDDDDDDDDDDNEPNAKKRSSEVERVSAPAPPPKTVTEPKIVVQTRSEVDFLDDGYKWRKYGQKVVKGNTHPRSYYRCTYTECKVRKHVERASADPKAVVTTYEGKHNHDIPIGRGRGTNGPSKLRKKGA